MNTLVKLQARGMARDAAQLLVANLHNRKLPDGRRDEFIRHAYISGLTYRDIAAETELSHQRVAQIVSVGTKCPTCKTNLLRSREEIKYRMCEACGAEMAAASAVEARAVRSILPAGSTEDYLAKLNPQPATPKGS